MTEPARIVQGEVQIEAPGLQMSATELSRFQAQLKEIVVPLATELRSLGLQLEALHDGSELLRASERRSLVTTSVLTTRDMVEAFRGEAAGFSALNEQVVTFSERMGAASEQLIATARSIGSVNRKLRVAGINVRLSASQLNEAGGSLAALTRELTGLATLCGERAASVVSATEDVGLRVSAVRLSRGDVDEASKAAERELQQSLSGIFGALDGLFRELTQAVSAATKVRGSIGRARAFWQRQEAMHRAIDHIRLALEEVDREFLHAANAQLDGASDGREQLCAYVLLSQRVGDLGAGLLERLHGDLSGWLNELRAALQVLRESTQRLAQTKSDLDGNLQQRLSAPAEALARFRALVERRLASTLQCGTAIAELQEPVFTLEELLANLASVDHRLRNLVVMMRIEMPRLAGLDDPAGLIGGVNNCHTKFVEFLGLAEEPLEQFRRSMADMKRTVNIIKKHHDGVTSQISVLHLRSEQMAAAGRSFCARFHEVADLRDALLATVTRFDEVLERFSSNLSALRDAQAACQRLASSAGEVRAALERAGLYTEVRAETPSRLLKVIALFPALTDESGAIGSL